jgi:hypothetical protein
MKRELFCNNSLQLRIDVAFEHLCNISACNVKWMAFVSFNSPSCEVPCLILHSVVYRDVTRPATGLYRLKHVGALKSGLAYLNRYNSDWFCYSAEPYTPNITNLSWYIGSISSRPLLENQRSVRITDGKANSPVSWGSLPSYLTIEGVVTENKVELCINLSSDRK